jgi:diguanylate cyclase (GGDEF)-like protein
MIDVDHFKIYNDTYGHQQGDKALCLIARVLTQTLKRTSDFVSRWGGEEFIIFLPKSDAYGGMTIAEEIRKNIEAAELPCDDGNITRLTVSIGVNSEMPTPSSSIDEFISKADKALYCAKAAGRNIVRLYE